MNTTQNYNGLQMIQINLDGLRKQLKQFIKQDKRDGRIKTWYFHHQLLDTIQAMDSEWELQSQIRLYENQGLRFYKEIKMGEILLKELGLKSGKLLVYRGSKPTTNNTCRETGRFMFDRVSPLFDYKPSDYEMTIGEIEYFNKPFISKPTTTSMSDDMKMIKKGLTKFHYGDNIIWSLNQKNADKKAIKKGWVTI